MTARQTVSMSLLLAVSLVLIAVIHAAMADPVNLLRVQTRTVWPSQVRTVADAAHYILAPIGYRLLLTAPAPRESAAIAAQGIAPKSIRPQTLPIEEALLALAGPGTKLIVDHQHKLVAFAYQEAQ